MKKIFVLLISIVSFNSISASLPASDPACSHEYQSAIGYYSSAIDIPTLGLSSIIPLIANDMCPDVSERLDNIDARLSDIDGKLTKLSNSIDSVASGLENLGNNLEEFQKEVYSELVERDRLKYEENLEDFDSYVRDYRLLYAPANGMNLGSIKNYFMKAHDAVGNKLGFTKVYDQNDKISDKISNTAKFIDLLRHMVVIPKRNESPVLMRYLDRLCGNAENIQGDIVRQRQGCNSIVAGILYDIDIRAMEAQVILLDEIDTVNLAIENGNINPKWLETEKGKTLGLFNNQVPWLEAPKEAIAVTNKYRDDVTKLFVGNTPASGLFPEYKGFPQDKYDMIKRVCSDPKTNLPRIIRWYTHFPASKEPFVITECLGNVNDPTSVVRSKVYYNRATRLDNILGVLVNHDARRLTQASRDSFKLPISPNCYNCFVAYPGVRDASGLYNVKFMLNSNVPLEINSVIATTKGNGEKGATQINQPDMSFVQAGKYDGIRPAYTFKSKIDGQLKLINLADANASYYDNTVSKFLYPRENRDGSMSKTSFLSNVYNSSIRLEGTYYPSLFTTVYLSFKAEGFKFENGIFVVENDISYVFGLAIFNGNGGLNEGAGSYENLALVCLDSSECVSQSSSGNREGDNKYGGKSVIKWFNGLSVEMLGDNAGNVTLKVNTKVDTALNEDANANLKKDIKEFQKLLMQN